MSRGCKLSFFFSVHLSWFYGLKSCRLNVPGSDRRAVSKVKFDFPKSVDIDIRHFGATNLRSLLPFFSFALWRLCLLSQGWPKVSWLWISANKENEFDWRLQKCDLFINHQNYDIQFFSKIMWFDDESSFKHSGHVNRHNCVFYANENRHLNPY